MSEEKPGSESAPLPPKLDLRRKGIVPVSPATPSTSTPQAAAPRPVAPQPVAPQAAAPSSAAPAAVPAAAIRPMGAKIDTSSSRTGGQVGQPRPTIRLSTPAGPARTPTIRVGAPDADAAPAVEAAATSATAGTAGPTATPKTIRISIPSAAGTPSPAPTESGPATVRVSIPAAGGAPASQGAAPIPLDKLGAKTGSPDPKTIRLKRPSEGPATAKTVTTAPAAATETSEESGEGGAENPTQKKTIKVRRPESGPGGRQKPMTIARSGDAPKRSASGATVGPMAAGVSGRPGPEAERGVGAVLAVLCGFAAVCVTGVVIWMFAAQGMPEWGLSWPGLILE